MVDEREETVEGQGSTQGEDNRDQRLETTLARMANFFERQGNRWNRNERVTTEVIDDVALERFQKFRPPTFNGEKDDEVAKTG